MLHRAQSITATKKAVGAVEMRQQPEEVACFESDSLLPEQLPALKLPKVAAFRQQRGDDVLVFLGEQAAGGVDQAPAGFYQVRGRGVAILENRDAGASGGLHPVVVSEAKKPNQGRLLHRFLQGVE